MGNDNKVTFGLRNAHFATYTEDETGNITYDKPISLPGSVELSLEAIGDPIEFYADDIVYYTASNNQGYEGTLSIAHITEEFSIKCLGEVLETTDKVLIENADSKSKPFALMFEFDGDKKAIRHVIYDCLANRPTVASSTKNDAPEPNVPELSFKAKPRSSDRVVKTRTSIATPDEIYNAWYNAVYEVTTTA